MEKVLTLTSTTIVPTNFTEYMKLSDVEHRAITFTMLKTIDELKKELKALRLASRHQGMDTEPTTSDTPVKVKKVELPHVVPNTKEEVAILGTPAKVTANEDTGKDREGATFGMKIGRTSRYHFVNIQKKNGRFTGYGASTSIGGKTEAMGSSKDEIQCALMADSHLDRLGDEKRKRNRDDFSEVMDAYEAEGGSNDNRNLG